MYITWPNQIIQVFINWQFFNPVIIPTIMCKVLNIATCKRISWKDSFNLWVQKLFWTLGLPEGSYVITHVRPWSVVSGPSLNISETALRIFLIFCMKLVHHKGTKVIEPDFWKKILGSHKWGKTPILGAFLMFLSISLHLVIKMFWNFIYSINLEFSNA